MLEANCQVRSNIRGVGNWFTRGAYYGKHIHLASLPHYLLNEESSALTGAGHGAKDMGVHWWHCSRSQDDRLAGGRHRRSHPCPGDCTTNHRALPDCAIPQKRLIQMDSRRISHTAKLSVARWVWCVHCEQVEYSKGDQIHPESARASSQENIPGGVPGVPAGEWRCL